MLEEIQVEVPLTEVIKWNKDAKAKHGQRAVKEKSTEDDDQSERYICVIELEIEK